MKKVNYLLYVFNLFLICLIMHNITNINTGKNEVSIKTLMSQEEKYVSYNLKKIQLDNNDVINKTIEEKNEQSKEKNVEIKKEEQKVDNVIETLVGSLVGYGPDCYGCTSNMTASGKYIGEGNIYYNDNTYGSIRIVAGDHSYPFGTIVKISDVSFYNNEPFYAIVLDRGGDIGKNKKFLFDLLFASESEAYKLGKEMNVKYEIMRLGY